MTIFSKNPTLGEKMMALLKSCNDEGEFIKGAWKIDPSFEYGKLQTAFSIRERLIHEYEEGVKERKAAEEAERKKKASKAPTNKTAPNKVIPDVETLLSTLINSANEGNALLKELVKTPPEKHQILLAPTEREMLVKVCREMKEANEELKSLNKKAQAQNDFLADEIGVLTNNVIKILGGMARQYEFFERVEKERSK